MALGVLALIVVLSVMNGFQKEIRARMLGASPHLEVVADGDRLNGLACGSGQGHTSTRRSSPPRLISPDKACLSLRAKALQGVMCRIDPAKRRDHRPCQQDTKPGDR